MTTPCFHCTPLWWILRFLARLEKGNRKMGSAQKVTFKSPKRYFKVTWRKLQHVLMIGSLLRFPFSGPVNFLHKLAHTHINKHTLNIYIYIYIYIHVCVYIYIIYVYIYIYIYIYARTHYSQFASHGGALSRCALNLSWAIIYIYIYTYTHAYNIQYIYIYIYTLLFIAGYFWPLTATVGFLKTTSRTTCPPGQEPRSVSIISIF